MPVVSWVLILQTTRLRCGRVRQFVLVTVTGVRAASWYVGARGKSRDLVALARRCLTGIVLERPNLERVASSGEGRWLCQCKSAFFDPGVTALGSVMVGPEPTVPRGPNRAIVAVTVAVV